MKPDSMPKKHCRNGGVVASTVLLQLVAATSPAVSTDRPVTVAVAHFDNEDTSGESPDRLSAHADRVTAFSDLVGDALRHRGGYEVVTIDCGAPVCSTDSVAPEKLIGAARNAGARLLVYGGIHKMSTLVQMGAFHAVDLKAEKIVVDKAFSFRGDDDRAFATAANFMARYIGELELSPP